MVFPTVVCSPGLPGKPIQGIVFRRGVGQVEGKRLRESQQHESDFRDLWQASNLTVGRYLFVTQVKIQQPFGDDPHAFNRHASFHFCY